MMASEKEQEKRLADLEALAQGMADHQAAIAAGLVEAALDLLVFLYAAAAGKKKAPKLPKKNVQAAVAAVAEEAMRIIGVEPEAAATPDESKAEAEAKPKKTDDGKKAEPKAKQKKAESKKAKSKKADGDGAEKAKQKKAK